MTSTSSVVLFLVVLVVPAIMATVWPNKGPQDTSNRADVYPGKGYGGPSLYVPSKSVHYGKGYGGYDDNNRGGYGKGYGGYDDYNKGGYGGNRGGYGKGYGGNDYNKGGYNAGY